MNTKIITDNQELIAIIANSQVCNVAFVDGELPYVLPFNFGFHDGSIYLHSAKEGRKIDILKKNNNVCISFQKDEGIKFQDEKVACSYSMYFKSVLVTGKVEFIEDFKDKVDAMNIVMKQYTGKVFDYNTPAIDNVCIMKIKIDKITGKNRGCKPESKKI